MTTGREDDQRRHPGPAGPVPRPWPDRTEWLHAVDLLRRLGRHTGNEHAITLTPSGECLGGTRAGDPHVVNVGPEVLERLDTPGEELAVCHTHPARPGEPPNELSAPDLQLLGRAGIRSMHMVSPYEPYGYSIAHRAVELDPVVWLRVVARARDISADLVQSRAADAYRRAHGLRHLDHQRVLVRMLDLTGLITWQRRFDGATAVFEQRHGALLDELADDACERLAADLQAAGVAWVDPGNPTVCHAGGLAVSRRTRRARRRSGGVEAAEESSWAGTAMAA
jgi:hypothetical protein